MAAYVAFLRAINLGPTRKFPKASIVAATQAAGGREVATYIASGNVRLDSDLASCTEVEAALEEAYLADRGFAVPTIVFTPRELTAVVDDIDALWSRHGEPAAYSVTLFKEPPPAAAVAEVEALDLGDVVTVRGRAAHVLLKQGFHESKALASKPFAALGQGTARNATVLREITRRWC